MARRARAAALVAAAVAAAACGATGSVPGATFDEPGTIALSDPGLVSIRASAMIEKTVAGKMVSGRVLLMASRPASLRIDAMSPADTPLAILTANPDGFALMDAGGGAFYEGPPSACNVERLLDIPMPPATVVAMLLGMPPLIDASSRRVAWMKKGYNLLTLSNPTDKLEQVVQVLSGPKGNMAIRSVVWKAGSVLYDLRFVHRQPAGPKGPLLPREIRFAMPGQGSAVTLKYDTIIVDPEITGDAFRQDPPPGFPVHHVDCGNATIF